MIIVLCVNIYSYCHDCVTDYELGKKDPEYMLIVSRLLIYLTGKNCHGHLAKNHFGNF